MAMQLDTCHSLLGLMDSPLPLLFSLLGLMDSPLHRDLMNHVAVSLATKWRIVGVQLGLSVAKLDEIEVAYVNDCKRCFSAVFSEWENTASLPYTWSTIIEVLKTPSVEENRLAERLKAQFTTNYDAV